MILVLAEVAFRAHLRGAVIVKLHRSGEDESAKEKNEKERVSGREKSKQDETNENERSLITARASRA